MTDPQAQPPHEPEIIPPVAPHRAAADVPPPPARVIDVPAMSSNPVPPTPPPVPPAPEPPPFTPPPPMTPPARGPEPAPYEPVPPTPPPPSPPHSGPAPAAPSPTWPRSSGWATAAHLTTLIALGFSFLLIAVLGPLVIWLAKKDEDPEAEWHGRESLNFQITMLLVWVAALPLYCACGLGLLIHLLQPLYVIVLVVIAAINAADGKRWRYPLTLRLLND